MLSVCSWREFAAAGAAGLALGSLQMFVLKTPVLVSTALGFLGLGSLFVLVVARIRSSGENRQLLQDATLPPLLLVLLGYFGSGVDDRVYHLFDLVLASAAAAFIA